MKLTKALTIGLLSSSGAMAATSGTLLLQGTVAANYAITVTPDGTNNSTLDILNGETNKSVANVLEVSNNPGGYKIQASSLNSGLLKNGSVDQVSYQIKYGSGSALSLTASAQTVYTSPTLTSSASNTQNVKVTFAGKPAALAGTYSDTVTFTISAP